VIVNYAADADGAESVVSAIRARDGRAEAVRRDVAAPDDVAAMFDRAQQQTAPLTALVNTPERSARRRTSTSGKPTSRPG
jgi:NAD(P)-dependent dehydrogenase (short-subunit alcohol dehydrogenase family)